MYRNDITLTGTIETLPKVRTINDTYACEFLMQARSIIKHGKIKSYEDFSIAVVAYRKEAKRCITKYRKGTNLVIEGSLSFSSDQDKQYSGFYLEAKKIYKR